MRELEQYALQHKSGEILFLRIRAKTAQMHVVQLIGHLSAVSYR